MQRVLCLSLSVLAGAACQRVEPPVAPDVTATPIATGNATARTGAQSTLFVEGSAFVLNLPDGRQLKGSGLAGAMIHIEDAAGVPVPVRLSSIVPDPEDPAILRHEFEVQDEDGHWGPGCTPNADGEQWGFPIVLPPGHPGREGEITLTCASGAVGKCVRFGYKPWSRGPGGEDLLPLHAACVRMVRADYCGDGEPHTRDGTQIDVADALGIQVHDASSLADPAWSFEAAWAPHGATCVARTRLPDVYSTAQLRSDCPRLAQAVPCSEAGARAAGAQLFNLSVGAPAN